jgi:putative peptidoglycan lipid II flippase
VSDDSVALRDAAAPKPATGARQLGLRALVVGVGTLVSRLSGLLREMIMAALYTRVETDAFFVAFRIPNGLRQILAEGAISSAVVPVLSGTLATDGEIAARSFFAKVRGLSLLVLALVSIAGVIGAEPLTELFAAGHHAEAGRFELTVSMTRWLFPYIFFMGSSALGAAALQSHHEFALVSLAPVLLNVAMVVFAWAGPVLAPSLGIDRVHVLALGALVGGLLQLIVQWPALRRLGYVALPTVDFSDPKVRDVLRRIAPMAVGMGIYQVDLILSTRFLAAGEAGSQSYFLWASRLCDVPQGIFGLALSTAALPTLAALVAKGEHAALRRTVTLALRMTLFVAIPSSVYAACFALPVVRVFFERGQFDAHAAEQTARSFAWQGAAIVAVACVRPLVASFYALGRTSVPVVVSALDLVAFIALAVSLTPHFGHVGVSMAVAGSSVVQAALLLVALVRTEAKPQLGELVASAAKVTAASTIAAALPMTFAQAYAPWVQVAASLGSFAVVFPLCAVLFRSPEVTPLVSSLMRRVRRRASRTP